MRSTVMRCGVNFLLEGESSFRHRVLVGTGTAAGRSRTSAPAHCLHRLIRVVQPQARHFRRHFFSADRIGPARRRADLVVGSPFYRPRWPGSLTGQSLIPERGNWAIPDTQKRRRSIQRLIKRRHQAGIGLTRMRLWLARDLPPPSAGCLLPSPCDRHAQRRPDSGPAVPRCHG